MDSEGGGPSFSLNPSPYENHQNAPPGFFYPSASFSNVAVIGSVLKKPSRSEVSLS
jgi:hypothetical protein